jgi:hypothetical protein
MSNITAIETRYAGCRFRSRLEARWAVFFDACGIRWEYEPQGFIGARGHHYLPDFYLPDAHSPMPHAHLGSGSNPCGIYVEVKGSDQQLRADWTRIAYSIEYQATPCARGLLILGPIPRVPVPWPLAYWFEGITYDLVDVSSVTNNSTYAALGHFDYGTCDDDFPDGLSIDKHKYLIKNHVKPDAYKIARSARFEHGEEG